MASKHPGPTTAACDDEVKRIPLGRGLFALVDAADYKRLNKYRWYATRPSQSMN